MICPSCNQSLKWQANCCSFCGMPHPKDSFVRRYASLISGVFIFVAVICISVNIIFAWIPSLDELISQETSLIIFAAGRYAGVAAMAAGIIGVFVNCRHKWLSAYGIILGVITALLSTASLHVVILLSIFTFIPLYLLWIGINVIFPIVWLCLMVSVVKKIRSRTPKQAVVICMSQSAQLMPAAIWLHYT